MLTFFLKCLDLARIGRPDILWSVNKLARSITKRTKACDKRLNRLISYIHHTCEHKQYCHVGFSAKQCRLGLFQDSGFAGDLEDWKSTSGRTFCVFGSHSFVPISWMCKKQTSVSHSSTESEIISLDAGLRLDGLPALELGSNYSCFRKHDSDYRENGATCYHWKKSKISREDQRLNNIDCVPSNVQSSHQEALLYVFEDNEAVIKMMIKGRSPTRRHVSRTHWVALDWWFDRINSDPKIQIKYIDTKKPTRWHSNQRRFHTWWVESFVVLVQCQPFQIYSVLWYTGETISTRFRRRTSHGKIATNDESYCKDAVARIVFDSVSPVKRSYGCQDPWSSIAKKEERSGRLDVGIDRLKASDYYYHEQFMESFSSASYSKWDDDRAWSSQEWKTDIETYERSGRPDEISWRMIRKIRPGFSHEETLHHGTAQSVKNEETLRDRSQFVIGNDEAELELSVESRSFVNRVNDQVRKRQKRISNVTENGEKHSMIWWMFMSVTSESALFMGKIYSNNQHSIKNTKDLTIKQMFDISTKLVSEQDEISGLETLGWENRSWKYLSLIGDEQVISLQRTNVYVFSDSVLCLGKIFENPESNDAWEPRLGWVKSFQNYINFDRIDGEPMEFEWNISPGFNTLQLSEEVRSLLYRLRETPEN